MPRWSNWCGSARSRPTAVVRIRTHDDVVRALDRPGPVRPVGAGHSASDIARSSATLLDLRGMDRILGFDERRSTVRVQGGVTVRRLSEWLAARGQLLRSVGTSWYPTVGGATATATHGSGTGWGTISDARSLVGMTLVTGAGSVVELDGDHPADRETFAAARTHLGALGVVTEVELAVEPGRFMEQTRIPLDLRDALDPAHRETFEHFEAWWFPYTDRVMGLGRSVVTAPAASPRPWPRFVRRIVGEDLPLAAVLRAVRARPHSAAGWMGRLARFGVKPGRMVGPWPRVTVGPRWLRARAMEVAVPADRGAEAVGRVAAAAAAARSGIPHHMPVNLRWVRGDTGSLLSPAADRDSLYLDFSWWVGMPGWGVAFRALEDALAPLGGRPHWGKAAFRSPLACVPGFERWASVRARLDPEGRFLNPFLRRLLAGAPLIPYPDGAHAPSPALDTGVPS